jgi:transglutaminase-like putative cysteine protease
VSDRARELLILVLGVGLVVLAATLTDRIFEAEFDPWPAVLAPIVPGIAALALPREHWGIRIPAQVLVVLGCASAAVVHVDGTLPSDLVRAAVRGPAIIMSSEWPAPDRPIATVTMVLLASLAGATAAELARSGRFAVAVLAPGVAVIGICAYLAAPAGPPPIGFLVVWIAGAVALLALAAGRGPRPRLRGRPAEEAPRRIGTGWAGTAAVVGLAVLVPVLSASTIDEGDRYDPREDRDDPSDPAEEISPLAVVQEVREREPQEDQFTVSTAQFPRWRQVALTRYDGRAWMPSDDFRPAGRELPVDRGDPEQEVTASVRLDTLTGRWLPSVDGVVGVSTDVRIDHEDSGLLSETPLQPGFEYQLTVRPVEASGDDLQSSTATTPESPLMPGVALPPEVLQLATQITAGAQTDYERALRIAEHLRESYDLDSEAPAGHTLGQLRLFLEQTQRGREEQFVAAYGLLATAVGLPVRISVGWALPEAATGPVLLQNANLDAWPEVEFRGLGWRVFDPVPLVETPLEDAVTPAVPESQTDIGPTPTTLPPPPVSTVVPEDEDAEAAAGGGVSLVARVGVGVLGVLAALALYVGGVLLAKARKRRRRRAEQAGHRAVSGAFVSGTDTLIDLGGRVSPVSTDREIVGTVQVDSEVDTAPLRRLADRSTRAVYSASVATLDDVDAAWDELATFEEDLRKRTGWARWTRGRLSLRSLRRGLRPW